MITLLQACGDKHLFAPWFKNPASWEAWNAFLKALFGLPMSDAESAIYSACTGRTEPPSEPASEAWLVCGRRSGKSSILALIAVYVAAFID